MPQLCNSGDRGMALRSRAHLVGSVPLRDTEQVLRTICECAGGAITRIPDGETGNRKRKFILAQIEVLRACPALVQKEELRIGETLSYSTFGLVQGARDDDITFGPLVYAEAAEESYQTFARLKKEGIIAPSARFLVTMGSPMGVTSLFITPESQQRVERAYERAMADEIGRIASVIPHDQLSIQIDVAREFVIIEGLAPYPGVTDATMDVGRSVARLGNSVPEDVELGYHLCYGAAEDKHFQEPKDAGNLVRVANAIHANLIRRLDFLHMPVPIERDDADYFAPLKQLTVSPDKTDIYLGLLHREDGIEGARRRAAVAQKVVTPFGVALECGMSWEPEAMIPDLLRLHSASFT